VNRAPSVSLRALALALLILALLTAAHAAVARRLYLVPKYDGARLDCVSYDPRYRSTQLTPKELASSIDLPEAWIREDLTRLATVSSCVRTYYTTRGMERAVPIADGLGLRVMLGVDVSSDATRNAEEAETAVRLARAYPRVVSHVLVGNEVLMHNLLGHHVKVPVDLFLQSLRSVRRDAGVPVSTSEIKQSWEDNPWLATETDFLALNDLPYWIGVSPEGAIHRLDRDVKSLGARYVHLPLIVTEVGWPSGGPTVRRSEPGLDRQFAFISDVVEWGHRTKVPYNYFEGFDQAWKSQHHEGRVGSQWGLFTASGEAKFSRNFADKQRRWGMASWLLGLLAGLAFLWRKRDLRAGGMVIGVVILHLAAMTACRLFWVSIQEYSFAQPYFWVVIVVPNASLFVVVLFLLSECADVVGERRLSRLLVAPPVSPAEAAARRWPFVSIHVACCNEPPEMVIATVASLLALDYERFEIIVIDNNTTEPALWRPLEAFCAQHPDRVRFLHEDKVEGYKAGALNITRKLTSPEAEILAIVDADYIVEPGWLRLTAAFDEPEVAVVQAPQAYREFEGRRFDTAVRDEYEGFFKIGMVQRNEDNACIQHGTMLLLRKAVLDEVDGWAEWCITEDTELEVRILRAGHRVLYTDTVYGRGLVPATRDGYARQRFRWVFGAITVLRHHKRAFLGLDRTLTRAQRYHFIAGWSPWIAELFGPMFTVFALILAARVMSSPRYLPPVEFAIPILGFVAVRLLLASLTYRARVHVGLVRAVWAAVAGASLSWVISFAVLTALVTKRRPFHRTAKAGTKDGLEGQRRWGLLHHRLQPSVGAALLVMALAIPIRCGLRDQAGLLWACTLLVLTLPFVAATCMAWASASGSASVSRRGSRR
jgi:cellulose synthase/poly-beta-1,6-N-acetylglucosamine synthase-like glycosyltransferase/exo-beta-1,3-glucanase (GH17 family)